MTLPFSSHQDFPARYIDWVGTLRLPTWNIWGNNSDWQAGRLRM